MVAFSRQQIDAYRQAQRDELTADAEVFLRQHFEERLQPCSSAEVRESVLLALTLGEAYDLTLRSEIFIYLSCACVCGLYLFEDPRCQWLFHEVPAPENLAAVTNFNLDTFAHNLGEAPIAGFFADDPFDGHEASVLAAERELRRPGAVMARALLAMTPARERLVATPHLTQFLSVAREHAERHGLGGQALTRYILLAWLFGVRFVDDPLCRPVLPFLRAADAGPTT
ncbi:hypothetical protein [Chondromyces apiculatus]|uniref:Uncharacterized protein n=1 Tax=Chondromyces apiculatus DSM 436 TaxID=1192034 RepID=A0A017SWD4_9BACT|nr:hypothetical protein [Chondromyces apiculatus]EYF01303.1 Hypothetical protein CAP_8457 [Chondromyces apiculatus DSM 436]